MKTYRCDGCGRDAAWPPGIELRGFGRSCGHILLPVAFLEYDFCGRKCFVEWIQKDVDVCPKLISDLAVDS